MDNNQVYHGPGTVACFLYELFIVDYCEPFPITNLILSMNLVVLQRTQVEDETSGILFDILDLHVSHR